MANRDEARTRFEAIAKGRYVPKRLSPEEAKARLREVDPGIDVSRMLRALDEGDLKGAGRSLFVESVTSQALAYFYPVIVDAVEAALTFLPKRKGTARQGNSTPT